MKFIQNCDAKIFFVIFSQLTNELNRILMFLFSSFILKED